MKKIMIVICAVMILLFALSGCTGKTLPDLPKNAIAFDMGTFNDSGHDNALFGSLEFNGRTYIAYGTINSKYKQNCIESCIGYVIQNEHSSSVVDPDNTSRRIYTLSGDTDHNFLLEYDDTVKLMDQPTFYRAIDTNGKNILIPNYIDALGYEFWGE